MELVLPLLFSKENFNCSSGGRRFLPLIKVHLGLASPQDGPVSQDLVWGCLCCFQNWSLTLLAQPTIVCSCLLILGLHGLGLLGGLGRVWDLWDCMVYSFL